MKKLNVDQSMCVGCGLCAAMDELHFTLNSETGLSEVISQDNIEDPKVQGVVNSCPVGAISIVEDEEKEND